MAFTLTPNMFLRVPGVGTEDGPNYAIDVNADMAIIDQHDHTIGNGVQITPAALNINTDLTLAGNSLTNVKSVQLVAQTTFALPLSIYTKLGSEGTPILDLWYNDGNGTPVQITSGGAVNATIASIPGESYSAGTFFWKQGSGSTTPANFDIGFITLRPNIPATTFGTTIQVNPALVSAYTLTLPNNPSGLLSNSFLTIDPGGNLTAGPTVNAGLTTSNLSASAGILGSQIANTTITNANIVNSTITSGKLANTTVTPGSYTVSNITVNAQGQITAASNGVPTVITASGTYNPTLTVTASASGVALTGGPGSAYYTRVGDVVTVSMAIDGQFGAAFGVTVTLPIASNFTTATQATGTAVSNISLTGWVLSIPSSQTVNFGGFGGNNLQTYYYVFTYRIV